MRATLETRELLAAAVGIVTTLAAATGAFIAAHGLDGPLVREALVSLLASGAWTVVVPPFAFTVGFWLGRKAGMTRDEATVRVEPATMFLVMAGVAAASFALGYTMGYYNGKKKAEKKKEDEPPPPPPPA